MLRFKFYRILCFVPGKSRENSTVRQSKSQIVHVVRISLLLAIVTILCIIAELNTTSIRIVHFFRLSNCLSHYTLCGCAAIEHADEMREVVEAMGCTPVDNEPGCCGKNSRNVAKVLMDERQEAARDADVIVVGCPMCQSKYDAVPGGKPVMHLAELVAAAFGDRRSLECHTIPVPEF